MKMKYHKRKEQREKGGGGGGRKKGRKKKVINRIFFFNNNMLLLHSINVLIGYLTAQHYCFVMESTIGLNNSLAATKVMQFLIQQYLKFLP